jgi:hypothetical protein
MKIPDYSDVWENFIKDNYFPTSLRNPRTLDFKEFKDMVYNKPEKTKQLILDMLSGDVLVLKNALSREEAIKIKKELYDYGNDTPEQDLREDSKIPNYHIKNQLRYKIKDGYNELAHSYYFYRWNEDTLKLFSRIDEVWDTVKIFNGLDINEYKNNLPEDKIIDRVQVLHYPLNSGEITCHCDKARWQKTNIGFNLTEIGEDYDVGGAYFLNSDDDEVHMEPYIEIGDAPIFLPSIFHGVRTPKSDNHDIDWGASRGRWLLLAQTVQSQCLENREKSVSLENYKKDPTKILENFKKDYK